LFYSGGPYYEVVGRFRARTGARRNLARGKEQTMRDTLTIIAILLALPRAVRDWIEILDQLRRSK